MVTDAGVEMEGDGEVFGSEDEDWAFGINDGMPLPSRVPIDYAAIASRLLAGRATGWELSPASL